MNAKPDRSSKAPSTEPRPPLARREARVPVTTETFDLYVRIVAQIAAETGLSQELTVEALMAYSLALPEADELIHGFIRGDLTLFPPAEENRLIMERDTRRLELETPAPESRPTTPLGRKLDPQRRIDRGGIRSERTSELDGFIKENPEVYRQVGASSHAFLVRWVMLHLMEAARARERVHRIAHDFWAQFPQVRQAIDTGLGKPSPKPTRAIRPPG